MENSDKLILLKTPMNELPLGKSFTKFFRNDHRGFKIPTLAEFIEINPFVKCECGVFFDFVPQHMLFEKKSKKWEILKSFLLKNGFTTDDWMMLLPKKKEAGRIVDDFSKLKKEQILQLPIDVVCPGKSTTYIHYDQLVKNILDWKTGDVCYKSYEVIRRKLRSLGFTKKDGDFMKIKNSKTKYFYVKSLVEKRGFTEKEALQAVEIGIKAGWIRV